MKTQSDSLQRVVRLFLALVLFAALPFYALAQTTTAKSPNVDVDELLKETQRSVSGGNAIGIVWWIPTEFWEASAIGQGATPENAKQTFDSLRQYTIVGVAAGKMGIGSVNWDSENDVRANTVIRDSSGVNYKALTEISSDAQGLLSVMKPVLTNVLGPMGQNFQFLVFPAKAAAGNIIADPTKSGSFSVVITDLLGPKESLFDWRLPLTSLSPQKFCPVGHERVQADWKFCPWHGVKLDEAVVAPALVEPAKPKSANP